MYLFTMKVEGQGSMSVFSRSVVPGSFLSVSCAFYCVRYRWNYVRAHAAYIPAEVTGWFLWAPSYKTQPLLFPFDSLPLPLNSFRQFCSFGTVIQSTTLSSAFAELHFGSSPRPHSHLPPNYWCLTTLVNGGSQSWPFSVQPFWLIEYITRMSREPLWRRASLQ